MKSLVGGVLLAIPTLALSVFPGGGRCAVLPQDPPPGAPSVQAWTFTDLGGVQREVDWQGRDRRGVLVFFFDLKSPDSLLGMNYLDALLNRARDFGLSVIGVEATGRQAADVRSSLQGYAAVYRTPSFPVAADPEHAAAKRFDSQGAPTVLLIGEGGAIIARRPVFDLGTAVELTRRVEQLLGRNEGFFSPALRDLGLSEAKERLLSARAEVSQRAGREEGAPALAWGDRLPAFEFTDTAGRVGRWAWSGQQVIRVAFFWSGASAGAAGDLAFFQGVLARSGGKHLEVIAVEATGLGGGLLADILRDAVRTQPAPSFPVVPDPQARLVRLFGAGAILPQTFLVGGQGEVLYRADGLSPRTRAVLEEKIGRAMRLGWPQPAQEARRGAAAGGDGAEAPSVSRRLARDETLRFNLSQGDYFFSNGQHQRAVLFYQRYLELEPESLHVLVRLAQIHELVREPVKAREYWEAVLRVNPDHAEGRARIRALERAGVR